MFDFILESKAYRKENMVDHYSTQEISEILFGMLLGLEIIKRSESLSSVYNTYKQDTLKYPTYDRLYLSTTDLGNIIATAKNSKEILKSEKTIDLPFLDLKHYLRTSFMNKDDIRTFFYKLSTRLRIHNADLANIRRDIVDATDGIPTYKLQNNAQKLIYVLKKYEYRMDILVLLQKVVEQG